MLLHCPCFCSTPVGWLDDKTYVPAVRIEKDIRRECAGYDDEKIDAGAEHLLNTYPENRLVKHLTLENCCMTYPARLQGTSLWAVGNARYRCRLPVMPIVSVASFRPQEEEIFSTQDRLTFKPTPEEIVEFTVPHLETAPFPIISFGQGCEGEPLLMWETIREAIIEIRKHTRKGSININTNGSMPKAVKALCEAGLNSIRVSTNSVREDIYTAYYKPNNYVFDDLKESLKIARSYGAWTSINYFVFPGMTDSVEEYETLRKFIRETDLCMIQWRNFNIDPNCTWRKLM